MTAFLCVAVFLFAFGAISTAFQRVPASRSERIAALFQVLLAAWGLALLIGRFS